MIPALSTYGTVDQIYADFSNDLAKSDFKGEISTTYSDRLAVATDNSIYQVIPDAVVFPTSTNDVVSIFVLAYKEKYRGKIKFAPRGGGTATNGQSLNAGIIIDFSKFMHGILEINTKENYVRVQPGVVLDQLNDLLTPLNFYFPPQVSTSSRVSIGGMINTDACGNGSKILGRTSDYVLELTCVNSKGEIFSSIADTSYIKQVTEIITPFAEAIKEKFSNVPRTLNGYNLGKTLGEKANLNYLFSGSEGTLVVVTECKLKISPLPKFKKTILLKYKSFDDALRAPELKSLSPLVIETIDEKLLSLARQEASYVFIKPMLDNENIPNAINIVEFVAENENELNKQVISLCHAIEDKKNISHHAIGYYIAQNDSEINLLWNLRKKSVGLISKATQGNRRPIPFIEDTAVPPENLADYIAEFTKLLDSYELTYGMYGHVDAGCIHIRPALDMQNPQDAALMEKLSKEVVALLDKYKGVMWGEHGTGYRSEFSKDFFGPTLTLALQKIKTLFDPHNCLNPGKICLPLESHDKLVELHADFRARYDKEIPSNVQMDFNSVMACNGNAACFNYAATATICPSYKVTHSRVHSPKGRAVLMREWLRLLSHKNAFVNKMNYNFWIVRLWNSLFFSKDYSHEVYQAMNGCLNCKACATQCPLQIDVPDFKSKFLQLFHTRYLRPLRDKFIAHAETIAAWQSKFPRLANLLLLNSLSKFVSKHMFKLVDLPSVPNKSLRYYLDKNYFDLSQIKQDGKTIILLQDAFTSFYEPLRVANMVHGLEKLGFRIFIAKFFPSGKGLHVKGYLREYSKITSKNKLYLKKLQNLNAPLVGIDPSITLMYREENVLLLQEWLAQQPLPKFSANKTYYLFSHCTEKSLHVTGDEEWQKIFANLGQELKIVPTGCCGMAGAYGHEVEHKDLSHELYKLSWKKSVEENNKACLATGYSCRSQIKRFSNMNVKHPLEIINELI